MSSLTINNCTKKESEDCHFFVTIKNNSSQEIVFSTGSDISFSGNESLDCYVSDINFKRISSRQEAKYQPYPYPDCIEKAIKVDNEVLLFPLYIIDANNYTIGIFPCEEFEERNTILRTYILTLEDLERLNYTINYPEDASIGVK